MTISTHFDFDRQTMANHVGAAVGIAFDCLNSTARVRGARHQDAIAWSWSLPFELPESPRIFSRIPVESRFAPRVAAIGANLHFGNDSFRSPGRAFNNIL